MNGTETRLPSRDPQIDGRRRLTVAHRWSSPPHLPRPVVSDPYRRMMWSLTSSGGRARWRVPQEARTGIVIHIWSRIAAESRISDTGQAALRTEATGEFCAGSVSSVRTDPNENGGREGATGNAWANPATSETPRRLVLEGGFAVHGGRDWLLRDGARALGFRDLRGCLQARCDGGYSIPRIATELGVRDWHVQAAGAVQGCGWPPSERYTDERIAVRGAPAAGPPWHPTGAAHARRAAAADSGRRVQSVRWQVRRVARLAELGFADLATYFKPGISTRAGRSSGYGPSCGSAAGGW